MVLVVDDIDHLRPGLRFVATVGVFDGVHLGHVHVLERLRDLAAELGATPVAITFDPHPQAVITGRVPDLICDPHEKLERMADAGAEAIVVQRFDEAFRAQTAEEFLERLARGRSLVGLVMSHESAFGRDRRGTVDTVRRLAARDGFRLVEVDTLGVDGEPVSSSRIRSAITAGDLDAAERLLGRRYAVTGEVSGDRDGRWTMIPSGSVTLPPAGDYAVEASWCVVPDDDVGLRREARSVTSEAPWIPNEVGPGVAHVLDHTIELEVRPGRRGAGGPCVQIRFVGAADEPTPGAGSPGTSG